MKNGTSGPKPGARLTLLSVANHLGISRTTVSVVLSDSPAAASIPQATRQRILDAAKELGYRPNLIASSLRSKRTMSVGIMVPDMGEGYFTLIMSGVDQYLRAARYFYLTACHYWQPELIADHPRQLIDRGVDGLLLINTPAPAHVDVPMITVSGHERRNDLTNVVLDQHVAARLALEHLRSLGHERIAFMKGQTFSLDAEERWNSILTMATDLGFEVDPELFIPLIVGTWSPDLGYIPVREMLQRRTDFTAIFCFNDISAIGAIRAIHDAGLSSPHDISVIGFDDIVGAPFTIPSLTTVRQPLSQMGSDAARLLLEHIQSPNQPIPQELVVEPELIVRESTGPARAL